MVRRDSNRSCRSSSCYHL